LALPISISDLGYPFALKSTESQVLWYPVQGEAESVSLANSEFDPTLMAKIAFACRWNFRCRATEKKAECIDARLR